MEDLERKMKEKLLEGLIEHMSDKMGDGMSSKFAPKAMEVSVAAPDKEGLADGLDHAKKIASGDEHPMDAPADDESDEDRLMALMGEKDKDEDEDFG